MPYKVTIIKIEDKVVLDSDWLKQREPFSNEQTLTKEEKEKYPQFAHIRSERIKRIEFTVLEQTIENLDVIAVIKAINGISS